MITRVFSDSWDVLIGSGANWQSIFNIQSPGREMYLKGLYLSIMYRNVNLNTYLSEDQNTTQRVAFSVLNATNLQIFNVTGGIAGGNAGVINLFKSANLKFEALLFNGIMEFTVQGFNEDPDDFHHLISVVAEIQEIPKQK